jgi:predicted nucleic acid-binding protein
MATYVDASAAAKLVLEEPESAALERWLTRKGRVPVTSDLTRTELLRATRRLAPERMPEARTVLDVMTVLTVSTAIFERAATLDPESLRSLDAIHLASALELGDELDDLATYDVRLAEAARQYGISVVAPGAGI